jgi:hypothetical protein
MEKLVIFLFTILMVILGGCKSSTPKMTESLTTPPTVVSLQSDAPNEYISPTPSLPISREEAIRIVSRGLPVSVIERADIAAAIHGWYWEVVFDNISATFNELTPYPIKPPPPGPNGFESETISITYQSIVVKLEVLGGDHLSVGAREMPRPGPYISGQQAIDVAKQMITTIQADTQSDTRLPAVFSEWTTTSTEAYLLGDSWVVLFWEEGNPRHRWQLMVDAVTGRAQSASAG